MGEMSAKQWRTKATIRISGEFREAGSYWESDDSPILSTDGVSPALLGFDVDA